MIQCSLKALEKSLAHGDADTQLLDKGQRLILGLYTQCYLNNLNQPPSMSPTLFGCPCLSLSRNLLFFLPCSDSKRSRLSTYRMHSSPKLYVTLAPMEFVYRGGNGGGETFMYIPRRYIHNSSCSHMRRSSKAAVRHPFVRADKTQASVPLSVRTIRYMRKNKPLPAAWRIIFAFLRGEPCLTLSQII